MSTPVLCTLASKNYLAYVRCLTESFLAHHPDGRVFVLLVDELDDALDLSMERFELILSHQLGIPDFEQITFRYNIVELNMAMKPFFFAYLFANYAINLLIYLDSDIYIYHPLTHVLDLLATHQIVLTPHLLAPIEYDDYHQPDEAMILRVGMYNLGFIALARGADTDRLLAWWQKRLLKDCVVDFSRGLFVDQRWMDLAVGFFESVALVRHPGYNVAFWNINHRPVTLVEGQWRVPSAPLVFFHFSGIEPDRLETISKHQSRYTFDALPDLQRLFLHYREQLSKHGYETISTLPYTYGYFDNGVKISDVMRYIWRDQAGETLWPQPFRTAGDDSFFTWLNRPSYHVSVQEPLITHLALEMHRRRSDWREIFVDPLNSQRKEFAHHFIRDMLLHSNLSSVFVQPMRESFDAFILNSSKTKWQQFYYLIRSFLRRWHLHRIVKLLVGQRIAEYIYVQMLNKTDITHLYD